MAKLRVLHMIGGLNTGGSQSLVLNLYKAINRDEIQFDFIIDEPSQLFYKPIIEELGGKIFTMPKFNGKNFFTIKKAYKQFFKEHPEYKILHSHVRSYASLYIPVAKKFGVKTIIHSHNTSNGVGMQSLFKKIMQIPLKRQADYLMSCSTIAGEWLFGKKACKKDNYIFVPNALNLSDFAYNEQARAEIRAEFNIEDKFVIGNVGYFKEQKNHPFLIKFFNEIAKLKKDAVLLLVGQGELRPQIEKMVKEFNIEDKVIFAGVRGDVYKIYQAMDVFAFPSLWEGLPVTVVEAQASGVPCFISNTITKDIHITELIHALPITNTSVWVESILNCDVKRKDCSMQIKERGFDVNELAKSLTEFYFNII